MRAISAIAWAWSAASCQGTPADPRPPPDEPPTLDCDAVADTLASLELGNYAPPDRRARAVEHQRAACSAAGLSADELACVSAATSRDAAERCSPRLMLDIECDDAIAPLRAAAGSAGRPASLAAELDRNLAVMARACDEDDWPVDVKRCLATARSFPACADKLPRNLQTKLAHRVADELAR